MVLVECGSSGNRLRICEKMDWMVTIPIANMSLLATTTTRHYSVTASPVIT